MTELLVTDNARWYIDGKPIYCEANSCIDFKKSVLSIVVIKGKSVDTLTPKENYFNSDVKIGNIYILVYMDKEKLIMYYQLRCMFSHEERIGIPDTTLTEVTMYFIIKQSKASQIEV